MQTVSDFEVSSAAIKAELDKTIRSIIFTVDFVSRFILYPFFVTLVTLIFAFFLIRESHSLAKKYALTLLSVLIIQLGLGISNIVFALPIEVAVLHNAGGAALLICVLFILSSMKTQKL
jgi:heme A synthase